MLSALRGVLKAAWQLGQMSADDHRWAADLKGITGSTLPAGRALTAGEIAALLEACAADPTLSPHDLRRTFASDLLDSGADIATVQWLMGHANVNTTARYDQRGEQARRRAVAARYVPYHKRRS